MSFKMEREIEVHLEKGMIISVGEGVIDLACVSGILWVTWPGSGDVILRGGDDVSVETDGVLCITAFSESYIHVRRIFAVQISRIAARWAVSVLNSSAEKLFHNCRPARWLKKTAVLFNRIIPGRAGRQII